MNLTALNIAAGNTAGVAEIWLDGTGGGSSLVREVSGKRVFVKMTTLDTLIKRMKIASVDAIVIDAEGYEGQILMGSQDNLANVVFVAVEIHHFISGQLGMRVDELMRSSGFQCQRELVESRSPYITFRLYEKVQGLTGGPGLRSRAD